MADDNIKDPQEDSGDSKQDNVPSTPVEGHTEPQEKTTDLPRRFEGKTAEEVAQQYIELHKTYGKQGEELGELRKNQEKWEALGRIIQSNPALYNQIKGEIQKISGQAEPNGEAKPRDDIRIATENSLINNFESKYGLDTIESDKRKQLYSKIGDELRDIVDPTGQMAYEEAVSQIPLDRLPKYLEKAYRLATQDDRDEQSRSEGYLKARQNNQATIGSISSSGVSSARIELTPEQKITAKKMRLSEDDYRKQLEEMAKE